MRILQIRQYEMGVRVRDFRATHAPLITENSSGDKLFSELGTALDDADYHIVEQASGRNAARDGAIAKHTARRRLRRQLLSLTRAGQIIVDATPNLDVTFKMPSACGDQRLVAAARAIVKDATPLQDQIVAHNMPTTIVADVSASIDSLEAAIGTHAQARESRAGAGVGIDAAIAKVVSICEKLDLFIEKQFDGNAEVLREWRTARHVSSVTIPIPTRKQPEPPAPAPTPAPTVSKVA